MVLKMNNRVPSGTGNLHVSAALNVNVVPDQVV